MINRRSPVGEGSESRERGESRTVQFLIERSCPKALPSAVLMGLPICVWVYWPAAGRAKQENHEGLVYRITDESANENGLFAIDDYPPGVCEHMGRFIE